MTAKKDRDWYVDTRDISSIFISFIISNKLSCFFSVGLYCRDTINIWDYVTQVKRESSRFYNFLYPPSNESYFLRPSFKMYSLDICEIFI